MKRLTRFTPSPAFVVACIALFVALSGSAYAAIVITGKNVKSHSLTGRNIKYHSLTGKYFKPDSIGGVTIKESRLGTVPSAESLSHSATVTGAGQAVRGKGVTSAVRVAATFRPA